MDIAQKRIPIVVESNGRLANQMFQRMWAMEIADRVGPRAEIDLPPIPEWGLEGVTATTPPGRVLTLDFQTCCMDEVAGLVLSGLYDSVLVHGWGMRLEYFPDRARYARLFASDAAGVAIAEDEIVIHIRAEDIESGTHRRYFPLPFDFYEDVVSTTGKAPVFMGQLRAGAYVDALRKRFPDARFLPQGDIIADFQTFRNAAHKVLSISSFAWLAAWLSDAPGEVHYPAAGLFDPRAALTNLMPVSDLRYRFWEVAFPAGNSRPTVDAATWAARPHISEELDPDAVRKIALHAQSQRVPHGILKQLGIDPEVVTRRFAGR